MACLCFIGVSLSKVSTRSPRSPNSLTRFIQPWTIVIWCAFNSPAGTASILLSAWVLVEDHPGSRTEAEEGSRKSASIMSSSSCDCVFPSRDGIVSMVGLTRWSVKSFGSCSVHLGSVTVKSSVLGRTQSQKFSFGHVGGPLPNACLIFISSSLIAAQRGSKSYQTLVRAQQSMHRANHVMSCGAVPVSLTCAQSIRIPLWWVQ